MKVFPKLDTNTYDIRTNKIPKFLHEGVSKITPKIIDACGVVPYGHGDLVYYVKFNVLSFVYKADTNSTYTEYDTVIHEVKRVNSRGEYVDLRAVYLDVDTDTKFTLRDTEIVKYVKSHANGLVMAKFVHQGEKRRYVYSADIVKIEYDYVHKVRVVHVKWVLERVEKLCEVWRQV